MRTSRAAIAAVILWSALAADASRGQGTRADYDRSNHFADRVRGTVFGDRVVPHWSADGDAFWYRVDGPGGTRAFWHVDAVTGAKRPAFDAARLAAAIGTATGHPADAERLPVDDAAFDGGTVAVRVRGKWWTVDPATDALTPKAGVVGDAGGLPKLDRPHPSGTAGDETTITFANRTAGPIQLFWVDGDGHRKPYGTVAAGDRHDQNTYANHVWVVTDAAGKTLAAYQATAAGGDAIVGDATIRPTTAPATAPPPRGRPVRPGDDATSPDGRYTAAVLNHDLVLLDRRHGNAAITLTTDGTAADGYDGGFCWSPDSTRLVATRTVDGDHRQVTVVQSSPPGQVQPRVERFDYLKPGDRIPLTKPHLFDVPGRRQIPVSDALFPNPWAVEDVRWEPAARRFTFRYNQRGHQVLRVIAVDGQTGDATAVIDERSKTFVDYADKSFVDYLGGTGEIVWMSERDGYNHLYLYDAATGRVTNQITHGPWVVRHVDRVDADRRQVWFQAGGVDPKQDPYYVHLCRANLDGTGLVDLTPGDGTHRAAFSPDGRFLVDTYSRVDLPPVTELRRATDGSLVCPLEKADATALLEAGWRFPERFVAKGRDGKTDVYGVIYRPTNFDPTKRYPVIEDIYAGPQGSFVPKAFTKNTYGMAMAELGFVVVQVDGMGTNDRSRAFHDVCWRNLGDAGFPDRIRWIKAAAAKHPEMDLTRGVGIYGTSAGGQDALRALEAHGDFYTAAVADCGCHDNRMDKIWWNELWMGWPVGPWYAEQSNVTHAKDVTGALLLIVGETDHNVDPASTMQVVNALVRADRDFDLLVIPNADHGQDGAYGDRRRKDFFVRHLLGVEPRRG